MSRPKPRSGVTGAVEGRVLVTEISGSESVIHLDVGGETWVSQSHGIHPFKVGARRQLHVDVDSACSSTNGESWSPDGRDHDRQSPPCYVPQPKRDEDFALKRVDLDWHDGGAYALLGPSGCGKTTLLNLISGLLQPSEGRILFDGRDVTGSHAGSSATSRRCSSSR